MNYFMNTDHIAQVLSGKQKNRLNALIRFVSLLLIIQVFQLSPFGSQGAFAQCSTTPSVMAKWDFSSQTDQCNGAVKKVDPAIKDRTVPYLSANTLNYCPDFNAGCAQALLGSKGFGNTPSFANALCLWGFYLGNPDFAPGWDDYSLQFKPEIAGNLSIWYDLPVGKSGTLTGFMLTILQKQFKGRLNFKKQGVGVYRNGVLIYTATQDITAANINATPMTFTFPTTPEFSSNGSATVKFEIVFGLLGRTFTNSDQLPSYNDAVTGYDDITVMGTCGSSPSATAAIKPATCGASGANADGKITLSNFGATDKYDYNTGATYTGGKTYATGTTIPIGGVITSTLPNPTTPQVYTVRVFTSSGCTQDLQVTLNPTTCPNACTAPTATATPTAATCTGTSVNSNGSIAITGITGGDKVGLSIGSFYTGSVYASATAATGSYTFSGLANPTGNQDYTVRVFNGGDDCFKDYTVTLTETACGCKKIGVEITKSGAIDPNSTPANGITTENDFATYEVCKGTQTIDLKLTKTVSPTTGTTCPVNTDFVWTLTLTNAGTMAATDIQVSDILPQGLLLTASNTTTGTYASRTGWLIPSLAAGSSATLTITSKAIIAGTFQNCAEVMSAFPLNDPNSTPGNGVISEDDYACASITVTGSKIPEITKEFSPAGVIPNVPFRLTIKITNNESTPITTTAPFVDNLPSSPAQMVIAATPNLTTGLAGVIATAGGTSITIPSGTVLLPGLNTIQLDVIAPSDGVYCNTIAAGALKTTSCDNLVDTKTCVDVRSDNVLGPMLSKTMLPAIVQTGQKSTLTITVENRNTQTITVLQDFKDNLPTGLILAGAVSGTCPNVSTFASTDQVGLTAGAVLAANSTCTIVVPVTSSTAGTYCNYIPANSMIGNVNVVGGDVMTGNEDHAEACVTVNATPCTAVGTVSITPSPIPTTNTGATVNLTASATGTGASTVYTWANSGTGTFSSQVASPIYTAPATAGTYTVSVTANNNLTGYGTCTASTTTTISVVVPAGPCTPLSALVASATPSSITTGTAAALNVTGTGIMAGSTYSWTGTGGFTAAIQAPSTGTIAAASGYSYSVTVTNANGTGVCTATATTSLTASVAATPCTPLSALVASATPNSLTTGNASALNVTGTGIMAGSTYSWTGTAGFTAAIQAPSTGTIAAAGGYSYSVTIINANGTGVCTASATTSLTVTLACTPPSGILAGISQVTCTNGVANANGKITLSGFSTEKYDLFTGDPYAGTATFATATTIPASGIIVSNLANPAVSQAYTIRVFNGNNCYTDVKVTLNNKNCTCPIMCEPVTTRKTKG